MATTCFFEEIVRDKEDSSAELDVEFGRSSFYGESLIYLRVGDTGVILNEKSGRELYGKMKDLARYLGYEEN